MAITGIFDCLRRSLARFCKVVKTLSTKIIENVIITVLTKPADEYKENRKSVIEIDIQRLLDAGIKVVEQSELHQRFAVIDQRIVWYGSASLLGFSDKTENLMRLDGEEIALELLKQYHVQKKL